MTGDPSETGMGNTGYLFQTEIPASLHFDQAGMVAMDNSGPNTNSGRFFITLAPAAQLYGQYTIFGKVLSGLQVLSALTPRNPQPGMVLPAGDELINVTIAGKVGELMHPNPDRYNWQSVLLFVILLTGLALYLGLASLMLLSSGFELVSPQSGAGSNAGTNFIIASGLGFCGLSMLPAVFFSFQRMRGKSIQPFQIRPVKVWQAIALGAGWIGAVLLSDFLYQNFSLGWLAAAPFYIISIGLPLVLLVWIGLGGIPLGSRNRFWGSLGIGMTVGPFLATLVEFFVYLGVFVILIFILALNPNWLATLQQLISQIRGLH